MQQVPSRKAGSPLPDRVGTAPCIGKRRSRMDFVLPPTRATVRWPGSDVDDRQLLNDGNADSRDNRSSLPRCDNTRTTAASRNKTHSPRRNGSNNSNSRASGHSCNDWAVDVHIATIDASRRKQAIQPFPARLLHPPTKQMTRRGKQAKRFSCTPFGPFRLPSRCF